jgi:menaquinone-dependent protoporphyrinogen oxidase
MAMTRILVAYASTHGSTREVADAVAATLRAEGLDVDVLAAAEATEISGYDAVVLGGALYVGRLHKDARRFLAHHATVLATLPVAVFAIGPRTLDPGEVDTSRAQLGRALAATAVVVPVAVTIFGGAVDPAKLRFPMNRMPASDARDWNAIEAWARELAGRFSAAPVQAGH